MTDDAMMTRVREWLASCVRVAAENGVPEDADLEAAALAFIDGEPARIAAAREEQREACADWLEDTALPEAAYSVVREARATPLTATPLADEIAALKARIVEAVRYWTDLAQAEARDAAAARARVAELEAAYAAVSPETIEKWRNGEMAMGELISFGHETGLKARVAELEASKKTLDAVCAVLGREVGNRGDSEGAVDVAERIIRERDEAVAALRDLVAADPEADLMSYADADERARAVLAKYPEVKR